MPLSLPPLAAVRAFEAAARHRSFTAAGAELGMTQAAVSYQIKVLEDRVGLPLFLRRARGVDLTPEGARLAERATEAFAILRTAFGEARQSSDEMLVISVLPTFAAQILAPRLGAFQIAHPAITTRVSVEARSVDLLGGEATMAIRAGLGRWPGLTAHYILPGEFTPMISPTFIDRHGNPSRPEDLLSMPLIDAEDEGWALWMKRAGLAAPTCTRRGALFGLQSLSAASAIAGHGVCLLNPHLFRTELARGDLIQPFEILAREEFSMYLVYPERRRNAPAVRAFRDWLLSEMSALTGIAA